MKELIKDFLSSKKYMFILSLITVVTWLFNAPMIALFFAFLSISLIYYFKAKEGALLCSIFMIFAGSWSIHFNYHEIVETSDNSKTHVVVKKGGITIKPTQ